MGSFVGASFGPPPMCMPMFTTFTAGSGAAAGTGAGAPDADEAGDSGAALAAGAGAGGGLAGVAAACGVTAGAPALGVAGGGGWPSDGPGDVLEQERAKSERAVNGARADRRMVGSAGSRRRERLRQTL
jgi:hypothetical protein